ncbi:MAG: glucose-6-phosphate isomerase [Syntrophobacterales bacterium]|jgi:glucose-6-phosphate isomerase|nr:glucose-6-phosphate isomerase [Syntrophobacterales bacterium]
MKRHEDPKWVQKMILTLDHNYAMAEFLGEPGLKESDLHDLAPRLQVLDQDLAAQRQNGQLGFMALPYQDQVVKQIRQVAKPLLEWCWDVVVLGIGGSALGARALHQALRPPQHNKFPMGRRNHKPGLWVADNIDPDSFYGLLDGLDMRRTGFIVVSKSGNTAETLAQFLWAYQFLKNRLGEDTARQRFIIVTDPEKGPLRRLAAEEHLASLSVPANVGGRFSVLSAVGLLPAGLTGIEVEELLAGARFMDQRLKDAVPDSNPAYRLAALYYLFATAKHRPNLVFMPYAGALAGMAEWFCQLWAESLGKERDLAGNLVQAGSTPIRALGVTDQHSQLQLYMEGPPDKLITFLAVDKFKNDLEIPALYPDQEAFSYLGGHSLNELIRVEHQATAFNLMKADRPNMTLHLPEVNPFTIGQLIFLLEVATVAAAGLFGVNAFDQPGVEGGKQTTYGLMGRPGFDNERDEFAAAPPALEKYRIV